MGFCAVDIEWFSFFSQNLALRIKSKSQEVEVCFSHPFQNRERVGQPLLEKVKNYVILSAVSDAQSASDTKSKDPYIPNIFNHSVKAFSRCSGEVAKPEASCKFLVTPHVPPTLQWSFDSAAASLRESAAPLRMTMV